MATLLLAAAGSAVGGLFGSTAAILGQAAGALVGGLVDRSLFGASSSTTGARLKSLDVQSSDEGAAIPRLFGRMRVAGEVIWATRFEEVATSETVGGKGRGAKTTTYSYFANFAVGLCEGPIARVGRVWANGDLLDLTKVTMRVYLGDETQEPDSLILARQQSAPAYRGLAYVVFERLPIEDFGNGLPQLTFEVIRPVGRLESMIRAVTLIPAATEFGYATTKVTRQLRTGVTAPENRHAAVAASDLEASLDELVAVCPALESVAVVVTWFGDDLRAGVCTIRPKVENAAKATSGLVWSVSGETRSHAAVVSTVAGAAVYGGTPSDDSVVEVIRALKARGLAVTFYPFVMMDVPAGNGRPDPYGKSEQAALPWRGRITCHPAKDVAGSPWGSAAATAEIDAFLGTAQPNQFAASGTTVTFSGGDDWHYRRMVLHYAALCAAAGGVETFLIGSELVGLTTVRGAGRSYPFVNGLVTLAHDVKSLLGSATRVSYAADWTEWNGHQAGAGDFAFHLDALWTSADVDFIGIDAYFPLSDWRDVDGPDRATSAGPYDLGYLAANVAGGEGFDWYYPSDADRLAGRRTPISDDYGKPWLWRCKDLVGWWSNRHYDRVGGVELATASAWLPGLKPIRFTEIGCPAVDFGPNQPNVFPDARSSEGRSPWFSHGRRDDAAQRRYLEALIGHFDPAASGFRSADNPISPRDGRRMVDVARAHVWTWDARPYPWFPLATDVWQDGGNWQTGHWLTGRLGAAPLGEVVEALAKALGLATIDATGLTPVFDGLAIAERGSLRDLLTPFQTVLGFSVVETANGLTFADPDDRVVAAFTDDDLATTAGEADLEVRRAQDADVPGAVAIAFSDSAADGQSAAVSARRDGPPRVKDASLPVMAAAAVMQGHADAWLRDLEAGRENVRFRLSPTALALEPGDVVTLARRETTARLRVASIKDGDCRLIEATTVVPVSLRRAAALPFGDRRLTSLPSIAAPLALVLDLPARDGDDKPYRPWLAVCSVPWPGRVAAYADVGGTFAVLKTLTRAATIGTVATAVPAGPVWRFDRASHIDVELVRGTLASASETAVLAGANLAAIGSPAGGWELIQFLAAELIGAYRYRLSGLLRGQGGSERLAASGHAAGADFVLLDQALVQLPLASDAIARPLSLRVGDATAGLADDELASLTVTPTGVGLRPLAPVHLKARREAESGDILFSWVRRTRSGGDDFAAVDVALGERTEAYEIAILSGDSIRRLIAVTEPAARYAAAAQVADFGAPPASLDVRITQMSETVGAGWPLQATIAL